MGVRRGSRGGGGGGMVNPMTDPGDLIVGGVAGAPTRQPVGGEGEVLSIAGGSPAWTPLSIPALSSTTPAALGVAAVGVGTTAARADHVHALPTGFVAGATTAEDMTGTGWTTVAGTNVTATWASSKLTITAASGSSALTNVSSDTSRLGASASTWDLCCRVDVVAGDGGSLQAQFLIGYYVDSNNYMLLSYTNTRTIGVFSKAAGSTTDHGFVSGPSSGQATGGEMWLRLTRLSNGTIAAWWGVGTSGALPTAWTRTHLIDRAAMTAAVGTTAKSWIESGWFGLGALSTAWTVDVLAIRTTWQGSL